MTLFSCLPSGGSILRQRHALSPDAREISKHVRFLLRLCPTSLIITSLPTVDSRFAGVLDAVNQLLVYQISKMVSIAIFSPLFIIPTMILALAGGICGNLYMKARLSVQRELSNAKAPVLGHFSAALTGISKTFLCRCMTLTLRQFPISFNSRLWSTRGVQE